MAKPFILYRNTVRTSIGENNGLKWFKVYIRDTVLPNNANRDFKSEGGFTIDYPTNDNQPNDVFYGSNCTIPFLVEDTNDQAFIDALIETQEERFFIEINNFDGVDETPYWRGLVITDEVEHENKDFPYIVNIVAVDGVSQLKGRDAPNINGFVDVGGFTYPKTLLESITEILLTTSIAVLFESPDDFIVTNFRWFETGMEQGFIDPFANLRYPTLNIEFEYTGDFPVDTTIKVEDCFTILERLLKPLGCRIIQLNGCFHIVQIANYKTNNVTFYRYTIDYARTQQNPNVGADGVNDTEDVINVEKILNNNLPISSGIYTQEEGALFRYFGAAKSAKAVYLFDQTKQQDSGDWQTQGSLELTDIDIVSDPTLQYQFSFSIPIAFYITVPTSGIALNGTFTFLTDITIAVSDGVNTYYADPANNAWTLVTTVAGTVTQGTIWEYPTTSGWLLQTGDILTPVFLMPPPPINGDVSVLIEVYNIPTGALEFISDSTLVFEYIGQFIEKVDIIVENTSAPDSSIVLDLGEVKMGDQIGQIFYQCWLYWNGTNFNNYTENWQIERAGAITDITQLYLTEVLSLRKKPSSKLDVTILGDYNPFFSVLYNGVLYAYSGGKFNSRIGAWEVTLMQVTYDNTGFNVSTTITGQGNPNNPTLLTVNDQTNKGLNNRVNWVGDYNDLTGDKKLFSNDLTIQDGWLSIATTQTTDAPAPVQEGDPYVLIGDQWTIAGDSDSSVIYSGHEYIFTEGKFLKEILVFPAFVGANYTNNVHIADVSDPNNIIYETLTGLTLTAQTWNVVRVGNYILKSGSRLLIWLESVSSVATTDFSDSWTYGGTSNNGAPPTNGWNNRNANNIIRFEYQSLGGDYTTQIQNLIAGSTITIIDTINTYTYLSQALPVDSGTYAEIEVSLISQTGTIPDLATCGVTFSSPIPQSTTFIVDTNYWNLFPPPNGVNVTPVLQFDGVDQAPTANVAFGVDIKLQDGSVSEDYNYLAYTDALSGGTSGGGEVPGQLVDVEKVAANPFIYFIENNAGAVKIKGDLFTLNPKDTMFRYDSNFNLVENPVVNEDPFFIRNGDNIILKDI